jgi:hypothetical protein
MRLLRTRRSARDLRLMAFAWAAAAIALARDAEAWYFPEHVVIAHDGLMQLPPELRDVLGDAVSRARSEGLALCARVDVPLEALAQKRLLETRMIRTEVRVDCVPYSALPALAGDHATSAAELRTVLTTPKGIEITSAVAYEWGRFKGALERLPTPSIERMSFVHDLDVAFYFIDPGYEVRAQSTRAHFVDAGRPIADVLRLAAGGDLDNSLAQFLAHHMRSLELASRGGTAEAILEHAFAMHFLQDAFAAGHLVMTAAAWKRGNGRVRQRHDFYNAAGLPVGHALDAQPCTALGGSSLELSGLSPCWRTSGDGYLSRSTDASDRLHAARAVTKAEFEFALALDPRRVVAAVEQFGEREQLALGQLVDPVPWWTVEETDRRGLRESPSRTMRLVRAAAVAIERIRTAARSTPAIQIGTPAPPRLFEPNALADALNPCLPAAETDAAFVDDGDHAPCEPGHSLALATVGVSLLRPLLAEWPAAQADPNMLEGESKPDLGWAVQLLAAANADVLFAPRTPVDFFAPSISVSAGFSYRWGTYLPGRVDRPLFELNVGISAALQYDSHGQAGGNPHVTFLDQELRWPVVWELLTSYPLPLDLRKGHDAGRVLFFNGVRTHEVVTNPIPVFWGIDFEALAIALSQGRGAYPLYAASPELRLSIGVANPKAAQPSLGAGWGPTLGIEFTGGYATFL